MLKKKRTHALFASLLSLMAAVTLFCSFATLVAQTETTPESEALTIASSDGLTTIEWNDIQRQITADIPFGQQAKLTPNGVTTTTAIFFGSSVAIDGDTAIIGARLEHGEGFFNGAAYIFTRINNRWSQQAKLIPNNPVSYDEFGSSVALDGDTALVGTYNGDKVYVFTRSGTVWTQQAKLVANDTVAGDRFGTDVALDGDTAVIGAYDDDDTAINAGAIYIFTRHNGIWSQDTKLFADDASGSGGFGGFGFSVAIDGETMIVGAIGDSEGGFHTGAAYVFVHANGTWNQQAKLMATVPIEHNSFGISTSLDGDTAVIGTWLNHLGSFSSGSAYVFTRTGTVWSQQANLTADDGEEGDYFGSAVAIYGETAVVSAYSDDNDSGSVYIFTRYGTTWGQQFKLTASDAMENNAFGSSVTIDEESIMIGSYGSDFYNGSAYVFVPLPNSVYLPLVMK